MSSPFTFNGPTLVTAAALGLTALAVGVSAPPVVRALTAPPATSENIDRDFQNYLGRHDQAMRTDQLRVDGRSAFFTPTRPAWYPRPKPPPQPVREFVQRPVIEDTPKPPPTPAPTPPPARYTGPPVVGFDGQFVYFDEPGLRIAVGEENESKQLRVVSAENAPWTVTVAQRGVEFEVEIFEKTWQDQLFKGRESLSSSSGGFSSSLGGRGTITSPSERTPSRPSAREGAQAAERARARARSEARGVERND